MHWGVKSHRPTLLVPDLVDAVFLGAASTAFFAGAFFAGAFFALVALVAVAFLAVCSAFGAGFFVAGVLVVVVDFLTGALVVVVDFLVVVAGFAVFAGLSLLEAGLGGFFVTLVGFFAAALVGLFYVKKD
jgi:hypothetical protein